jgi:hypothetical protein
VIAGDPDAPLLHRHDGTIDHQMSPKELLRLMRPPSTTAREAHNTRSCFATISAMVSSALSTVRSRERWGVDFPPVQNAAVRYPLV